MCVHVRRYLCQVSIFGDWERGCEWMCVRVCEPVCECEQVFGSGYVNVSRCVRVLSVSVS